MGGGVERNCVIGFEKGLVGMDFEFKGLVWRREIEVLSGEIVGFLDIVGF